MYIERDESKTPVQDFLVYVKPRLNGKLLAEAEKDVKVVGWNIIRRKENVYEEII
jgi:hypothetical protein